MYLLHYENGEENYVGPFEKITLDGVNDEGFIFLCYDSDFEITRHYISGSFEVVKDNYLEV